MGLWFQQLRCQLPDLDRHPKRGGGPYQGRRETVNETTSPFFAQKWCTFQSTIWCIFKSLLTQGCQLGNDRPAGKKSGRKAKPPKDIFVKPLAGNFRDILKGTVKPTKAKPKPANAATNNTLADMWTRILSDLAGLARDHDQTWVQRHRVLNSLLVILFVFRLVLTPGNRGYAIVLSAWWEQCRKLGIPLPHPQPWWRRSKGEGTPDPGH